MTQRSKIKRAISALRNSGLDTKPIRKALKHLNKQLLKHPPQKPVKSDTSDESEADRLIDHWNSRY
jgi:hypothetical protein